MRTLASALDMLLSGDLSRAGDILIQRYKALEESAVSGHWDLATELEAVAHRETTLTSDQERRRAPAQESPLADSDPLSSVPERWRRCAHLGTRRASSNADWGPSHSQGRRRRSTAWALTDRSTAGGRRGPAWRRAGQAHRRAATSRAEASSQAFAGGKRQRARTGGRSRPSSAAQRERAPQPRRQSRRRATRRRQATRGSKRQGSPPAFTSTQQVTSTRRSGARPTCRQRQPRRPRRGATAQRRQGRQQRRQSWQGWRWSAAGTTACKRRGQGPEGRRQARPAERWAPSGKAEPFPESSMTDLSCAGAMDDVDGEETGEARLLGLTSSETGFELLREAQHDTRGLGSWIELLRLEGHSRLASGTQQNASREVMPLPVPTLARSFQLRSAASFQASSPSLTSGRP